MKSKIRFFSVILLLILAFLLTGCKADTALSAFESELQAQDPLTLEVFQENYETARSLLASGVRPSQNMPVFDPAEASGIDADGFYAIQLDEEVYGVSMFYVIPAGLRAMTAEEYLALAQLADMPAGEIVRPGNSWISLQGQQSTTSRSLSAKERFWIYFQGYDHIFRNITASEQ